MSIITIFIHFYEGALRKQIDRLGTKHWCRKNGEHRLYFTPQFSPLR